MKCPSCGAAKLVHDTRDMPYTHTFWTRGGEISFVKFMGSERQSLKLSPSVGLYGRTRKYTRENGMKKPQQVFLGILFSVFMLAAVASGPAAAQEKAKDAKAAPAVKAEKGKATRKDLFENDKVRVFEITFKPGDVSNTSARPFRVTRALKGGTLMRNYDDGKTEKNEWKTGEVKALEAEPQPYSLKNVGKTDVVLYNVFIKEPKK